MKSLLRSAPVLFVLACCFAASPTLASAATPSITTGTDHACAVSDVGTAYCWGGNDRGQLGTGNTTESPVPLPVVGLPAAVSSIHGGDESTCALLVDATVWCWGRNTSGELANGTFDVAPTAHPVPAKVTTLSGVVQLSGAKSTYCALLPDATARCWGDNGYSEVGNGVSSPAVTTPTSPTGLTGVKYIAAGYAHTCAILLDGSGRCWGYRTGGIIGDGDSSGAPSSRTTPVAVSGLSGGVSARLSGYSSCAIVDTGRTKCWGNASMVGTGQSTSAYAPVEVMNLSSVFALGGSNNNNCAISVPNQLKCWGNMAGDGGDFSAPAPLPVNVTNGADALAVSGNGFNGNVCFAARGGAARCWGSSNLRGEIGNGTTGSGYTLTPVGVVGLDLVTANYSSAAVNLTRVGKTKLDKKKKTYAQRATLRAALPPLLGQADGCTGTVSGTVAYSYKAFRKVKGKRKKVKVKKTAKASAALTAEGWDCVSTLTYKLPVKYLNNKKIALKATWPGNGSMNAFAASTSRFTLPKVKPAKKK